MNPRRHPTIPRHRAPGRPPRWLYAIGLVACLWLSPALAQTPSEPRPATPAPDARTPATAEPRASSGPQPAAPDAPTISSDMKTTVPQPVMREQGDFRLERVLRNVPGVGVNR
jgi:hypothetical protein